MSWVVLVVFMVLAMAGAWIWGKMSDPKRGGAVGCCHCGQCLAAGECVLRKNLQEKNGK